MVSYCVTSLKLKTIKGGKRTLLLDENELPFCLYYKTKYGSNHFRFDNLSEKNILMLNI